MSGIGRDQGPKSHAEIGEKARVLSPDPVKRPLTISGTNSISKAH